VLGVETYARNAIGGATHTYPSMPASPLWTAASHAAAHDSLRLNLLLTRKKGENIPALNCNPSFFLAVLRCRATCGG